MSKEPPRTAIKATAQSISDDDIRASEMGMESIPDDEVIAEPNPADYVPPYFLSKTAPALVGAFGELLESLREINALHVGEPTIEAQAYLSLTGGYEELEQGFFKWSQQYFSIRGDLRQLNPRNGNDPWRLYLQCYDEFRELLGQRLIQPGTINSAVLNLTRSYMDSGFAARLLTPDLDSYAKTGRDRFGNAENRLLAKQLVGEFYEQIASFTKFLGLVGQNLPSKYVFSPTPEWAEKARQDIERHGDDLVFLRYVVCGSNRWEAETCQIAPGLWGRFDWDVYHGGSIGFVLTSTSAEQFSDHTTEHLLSIRRDGWLCNREYGWIRVDPEYKIAERRNELAVNWFLLDTLTAKLYEAWLLLDTDSVINRGIEPDATQEKQTAALAVALAETDDAENATSIKERVRVPRLKLSRIRRILTTFFDCEWSQAKGSEQKVYRRGGKPFTFGCHGKDRDVYHIHLQKCLARLQISVSDFISVIR